MHETKKVCAHVTLLLFFPNVGTLNLSNSAAVSSSAAPCSFGAAFKFWPFITDHTFKELFKMKRSLLV